MVTGDSLTRLIIIPIKLDTHRESFDLFLGGDIHYPDPGCDVESFLRWRDEIVENEEGGRKTYNALMGDYCSVYVNGDRRRPPSNQLPDPLKVYSQMRDWIKPIAKTNVCTLTGTVTDGPAHGSAGVQNEGRSHEEYVSTTTELEADGVAIIQLAAGKTISLAVKNTDAGNPTVTVSHGNLTVVQIAGASA